MSTVRYFNMIPEQYAPDYAIKCAKLDLFSFSPSENDVEYIHYHVSKIIELSSLSDEYCIYVNTTNTFVVVEVAKVFIDHKTPCVFSYMSKEGDVHDQVIYEHSIKEAGESE